MRTAAAGAGRKPGCREHTGHEGTTGTEQARAQGGENTARLAPHCLQLGKAAWSSTSTTHSPPWKGSSPHHLFPAPEAAMKSTLQSKDGSRLCRVDRRVGDKAKPFQCNCLWSLPFYQNWEDIYRIKFHFKPCHLLYCSGNVKSAAAKLK